MTRYRNCLQWHILPQYNTIAFPLNQIQLWSIKCSIEIKALLKLVNLTTGQSEKIDALRDLVKSGHNLLRTVDGLLKDIQTLGDIDIDSKLHVM